LDSRSQHPSGSDFFINGIIGLINCEDKQFNKTSSPQTENANFQLFINAKNH